MQSLNRRQWIRSVSSLGALGLSPRLQARESLPAERETDIVIVGAGASGLYAAMKLRELGLRVIVLEKEERVGGHSETIPLSEASYHADLGVRYYPDLPIITETFARYGVGLHAVNLRSINRAFVDRDSGLGISVVDADGLANTLSLWKWKLNSGLPYSYLNQSGIRLPTKVPEELLLSFDAFLKGHGLAKDFAPHPHYLQGLGPLKDIPALYALKNFSNSAWESLANDTFWEADRGAQEIYKVMAAQLGEDLITGLQLTSVTRQGSVEIMANRGRASTRIKAKSLFIAFPPTLDALSPFDLDAEERNLFASFGPQHHWSLLVRSEGLLPDVILYQAKGDSLIEGQSLPGLYVLAPSSVPGLSYVRYGASSQLSEEEVKMRVTTDLERLSGSYCYGPVKVLGYEAFRYHASFGLRADGDAIRSGLYQKLEARQGKKSTYLVGATLDTHDTASVWQHADDLIVEHFPISST